MTFQKGPAHCKVCGAAATLFDVVDFAKHCSLDNPYVFGLTGIPVYYLRCQKCGFIFTEHCDGWSAEDFRRHIYNDEYHLVDGEYETVRPNMLANLFAELFVSARDSRILDYGSGSGAFENALQPRGFKVTSYDPFSHPDRPKGKFDLITCFEVMEHAPDPLRLLDDLADFMAEDGAIVFSTGVQPTDIEKQRGGWWYIAPRNGHVSIFSEEALSALASKRGLNLFRCSGLLAFGKKPPLASAKLCLWYLCGAPDSKASPDWHGVEMNSRLARISLDFQQPLGFRADTINPASAVQCHDPSALCEPNRIRLCRAGKGGDRQSGTGRNAYDLERYSRYSSCL